ncbi:hypothetical protein MJT46_017794 [Ovis ammon polii x Ovis aries]|nr:hypothetical protein MJT46_017794 [Ovis ammon polii x Ovis aries]
MRRSRPCAMGFRGGSLAGEGLGGGDCAVDSRESAQRSDSLLKHFRNEKGRGRAYALRMVISGEKKQHPLLLLREADVTQWIVVTVAVEGSRGYSLVVMCGLLIDVAFVMAEPQALGVNQRMRLLQHCQTEEKSLPIRKSSGQKQVAICKESKAPCVQVTSLWYLSFASLPGPYAATSEAHKPWSPVLCNKRSHCNEKPVHRNWRAAPARCTWRKPERSNEDSAQPKINK